jgi:hypothetical protein
LFRKLKFGRHINTKRNEQNMINQFTPLHIQNAHSVGCYECGRQWCKTPTNLISNGK